MTNNPVFLVVEDDEPIRNFICVSLRAQSYTCIETDSGKTAVSLVASHSPDVIILDLGLPDLDGLDVIRTVRPWTRAAIIVVSARERDREKAQALDLGADDYLTKPFSVTELLARVRVALRHQQTGNEESVQALPHFTVGDLTIDSIKRRVALGEKEIHLTPHEYNLLVLLAKNAGKVLTHNYILKEIWGPYSLNDTQSLRVFMANIRRKIEEDPARPRYITTEVGVGYRLADD